MNDPRWREGRPSRPYAGEPDDTPYAREPGGVSYAGGPGATPYDRDPRLPAGGPAGPARGPGCPGRAGEPPRREAGRSEDYSGGAGAQRRGRSWEDGDPGAPTRQLPARPGGAERGVPAVQAARDLGSRGKPAGSPRPGLQWGSLQGGLGVCLIIGSTAIGAIATMATRNAPGLMLGVFVVIGTLAAALAVRPAAGRMILPVPVLSYLVAALVAGMIYNRSAGSSKAALAIAAAQWIASGFFPMAFATAAAVVLVTVRWGRWRFGRRTGRGPGGSFPEASPARRPQAAPAVATDSRYPPGSRYPAEYQHPAEYRDPADSRDRGPGPAGAGAGSWNDANWNNESPPGPGYRPPGPGYRPPGPGYRSHGPGYRQPGSGPYNFSSGA